MEKRIRPEEILNGDTIRIIRTIKVDDFDGKELVRDKESSTYFSVKKNAEIYLVDRPEPDPEHWPPHPGDVWRIESGSEYHYLGDTNERMYPATGRLYEHVSKVYVKTRKPKLVYRKGNS